MHIPLHTIIQESSHSTPSISPLPILTRTKQQQRCRYCKSYPASTAQFLTDLRTDQEVVLLAMLKASTCEAFHSVTAVTLAGVTALVKDDTTTTIAKDVDTRKRRRD